MEQARGARSSPSTMLTLSPKIALSAASSSCCRSRHSSTDIANARPRSSRLCLESTSVQTTSLFL
eukprot:scaffold42495_cov32-Tisochrysis_lutea.AAC.1